MISILIPSKDNYFHCYAEGLFVSKLNIDDETEITLDDTYPFILYYHFPHHRRIYICSTQTSKNKFHIYNVNKDFNIIGIIEGSRAFDRFKKAMDFLNTVTRGEVYKLPCTFFWQLSYLCKFGKNSQMNIEHLIKSYKTDITFEKEIKWSEKNIWKF